MKICLLVTAKTEDGYIRSGVEEYLKRLRHYIPVEVLVIPDNRQTKNLAGTQRKEREGELILKYLDDSDRVVLLDEKGREFTSRGFSDFLSQKMLAGTKRLVFIAGGPYGFSDRVYQRAQEKIALSQMTFSHQMVRVIFLEQLYRAFTIIKGESYHHE